MLRRLTRWITFLCVLYIFSGYVDGAEILPRGIPFISDPPPSVDGSLSRFAAVPGWQKWNGREQVLYSRRDWRGLKDLSGEALLSWDRNYLYIAAKVQDDHVLQPYFGANFWRGDYVMVILDLPRQATGVRSGEKLFRIGLSPGNLASGEDISRPEIYCWSEPAGEISGAKIASRKTAEGYDMEAAIPWSFFKIDTPEEGVVLAYDIVASDADNEGLAEQEQLVSLGKTPWSMLDPERLIDAALGNADGTVNPATLKSVEVTPIGETLHIRPGESVTVSTGKRPDGKELVLRARNDFAKIAGGSGALQVEINGTELGPEYILNRLETFTLGAREVSSFSRNAWFVLYAPDFTLPARFSNYDTPEIEPYDFRFDVSSLWNPENNTITITNKSSGDATMLVVELASSPQLSFKMAAPVLAPAPTGEIPLYEPALAAPENFFAWKMHPGGALEIRCGKHVWNVESAFSTTSPGWARFSETLSEGEWEQMEMNKISLTAQSAEFTVKRTVEVLDDHLIVSDELTNTSEGDVPVMLRHELALGVEPVTTYIAGRQIKAPRFYTAEGEAPTSLAVYSREAIGLVMEDDHMRAQGQNYVSDGKIGVENNHLVLAKGKSVTTRFSVYPVERPDPFLFINRIRQAWGVNFTIEGPWVLISLNRPPANSMSDEEFAQAIRNKGARYISLPFPQRSGIAVHGTGMYEVSHTAHREFVDRLKKIVPKCTILSYLHTFISNGENDQEEFTDARLLRPDGTQADYRNGQYPIFLPLPDSPFAREQEGLIDLRFEQLGVDGIYWDEVEYSALKWDYSPAHWDGVSGLIDTRTHKLTRKISNVMLATQAWRIATAKALLERGPLVGNGSPQTAGMTQVHFPRFAETGSISNLTKGQLYSPISLGDHLTERTVQDCYRNMLKALDYGSVYYWYTQVYPTEPTLTSWMFPVTPVALGEGFIIGEERILTNRSGYFGWGDKSTFEAVVFNEKGQRTDAITIPLVVQNGKNLAEVRIPGGYSVALIRKAPKS